MTPAAWLRDHADLLPVSGRALDVACGRGQHALWLAGRGLTVLALDRDEVAISAVREAAAQHALPVVARVTDLETGDDPFDAVAFEVIVVVHYLHRPLFPALIGALSSGAVLVYETFTHKQAQRGKPTNPDFLLEEGELRRLVQPLEIVDYREGLFEQREIASVVARKR